MAKRKHSAAVSPKKKRAKHAPLPLLAAEDHSPSPSGRGTSPQGSVMIETAASEAAEEPTAEDETGASNELKVFTHLQSQ
jgi:hypothetical protein